MEPRFLMLARFAEASRDGTVNVIGGGLEKLSVDGFPAAQAALQGVAKFRLTRQEVAEPHKYDTIMYGPDGEMVHQGVTGLFQPRELPEPALGLSGVVVFHLANLIFPKAGWYRLSFQVDDVELMSAPLRLIERREDEEANRSYGSMENARIEGASA